MSAHRILRLAVVTGVVSVLLAGLLHCGGTEPDDTRTMNPHASAHARTVEYRADGRLVDARHATHDSAAARRPNLIVLVVDTLRHDCVAGKDGGTPDMPYVRSLGRRGMFCTQVTAPAPWTFPSMVSLLTGLLPTRHGADHTRRAPRLSASVTTFAEVLARGHGYETAAFLQVPMHGERDSPLQGFAKVSTRGPLRQTRKHVTDWNGKRDASAPFFLLLHTYEAHDPYGAENHPWPEDFPSPASRERTPDPHKVDDATLAEAFLLDRDVRVNLLERGADRILERMFRYYGQGWGAAPDHDLAARLEAAYRKGVRSLDAEIEATVRHLESLGLLENSLLVITSDHGEAFGEHGILNHGRALHEELVHVPLVAVGPPPFEARDAVATSMGLIDVLPTFLDLARIPSIEGVDGRSMLGALAAGSAGRAVYSCESLTHHKAGRTVDQEMLAARTDTESYILTYDVQRGTIVEQLYDRSEDPHEREDRAMDGRVGDVPVDARLAAAIETIRSAIWAAADDSRAHQQLGYAAGAARVTSPRPEAPTVRRP